MSHELSSSWSDVHAPWMHVRHAQNSTWYQALSPPPQKSLGLRLYPYLPPCSCMLHVIFIHLLHQFQFRECLHTPTTQRKCLMWLGGGQTKLYPVVYIQVSLPSHNALLCVPHRVIIMIIIIIAAVIIVCITNAESWHSCSVGPYTTALITVLQLSFVHSARVG